MDGGWCGQEAKVAARDWRSGQGWRPRIRRIKWASVAAPEPNRAETKRINIRVVLILCRPSVLPEGTAIYRNVRSSDDPPAAHQMCGNPVGSLKGSGLASAQRCSADAI